SSSKFLKGAELSWECRGYKRAKYNGTKPEVEVVHVWIRVPNANVLSHNGNYIGEAAYSNRNEYGSTYLTVPVEIEYNMSDSNAWYVIQSATTTTATGDPVFYLAMSGETLILNSGRIFEGERYGDKFFREGVQYRSAELN